MYLELPEFELRGTTLIMSCEIGDRTPKQLRQAFARAPGIETILLNWVPGSLDDEANLEMAAWVAERGITTRVNRYSMIASGGTDFFLSGRERIVEDGALIGVHSGGTFDEPATDHPPGDIYHLPYIGYYQRIGFTRQQAEDFYYFTLNAAPEDDMHYMTHEEIAKYNITTTGITPAKYHVPELEDHRYEEGAPSLTPKQARRLGLTTITEADYLADLWPEGSTEAIRHRSRRRALQRGRRA